MQGLIAAESDSNLPNDWVISRSDGVDSPVDTQQLLLHLRVDAIVTLVIELERAGYEQVLPFADWQVQLAQACVVHFLQHLPRFLHPDRGVAVL